ncbi:zinc-binding alcohol dehydrogenase family protein [Rhizobium panacihumi]|uniref:zinc-binding alcohol dehydrogenase family protein n=1 Tax=Rhizobium panacihumi TaxID=2008450 RepID=UPI003D791A02
MSRLENPQAAWQKEPGRTLAVEPVIIPHPASREILVRNHAVAINPLDWLLQDDALLPWLDYPAILGSDIAGEVVAVGDGVTRFRPGDRVLGQAVGTTINQPSQGAFQTHTAVFENMAAPIPASMSYVDAAVLPLGLGTAACGLYQGAHLGLAPPSATPSATGETILVWGAASSVGCNAIQLAVASGYDCIAVASQSSALLLRQLGAVEVFDYRDPAIVDEVSHALEGRMLAGALHATGNQADCVAVVSRSQGLRAIAMTLPPDTDPSASVKVTHIHGTSLKDDGIGDMIYRDFLPDVLARGAYRAAPPARIVGSGVAAFQEALEIAKSGVSREKLVVTLP